MAVIGIAGDIVRRGGKHGGIYTGEGGKTARSVTRIQGCRQGPGVHISDRTVAQGAQDAPHLLEAVFKRGSASPPSGRGRVSPRAARARRGWSGAPGRSWGLRCVCRDVQSGRLVERAICEE